MRRLTDRGLAIFGYLPIRPRTCLNEGYELWRDDEMYCLMSSHVR